MEDNILAIQPGILVSVSSALRGGVEYRRRDLEHTTDGATTTDRWETVKVVRDEAEYDAGVAARATARNRIAGICAQTPFGLICPETRRADLLAAIQEAYDVRDEFNSGATSTTLRLSVLPVRLTSDDAEAIRSIRLETARLVTELDRATRAGDIDGIRDVAKRSKAMLSIAEDSPVSDALGAAVLEARKVAKEVKRRVVNGGERLADVLEKQSFAAVSKARAILDRMGETTATTAPKARALDIPRPAAPVYGITGMAAAAEPGTTTRPPIDPARILAAVETLERRKLAAPVEAFAVAPQDTPADRALIFGLPSLAALPSGEIPEKVAEPTPEPIGDSTASETAEPVSWRPEFLCQGTWCGNGQRFATEVEALESGAARAIRWTQAEDYRAVGSPDPVGYRRVDGVDEMLPAEPTATADLETFAAESTEGPPARWAADPFAALASIAGDLGIAA